MYYKHGRFKRLFAMFLVLVMLATSGNGYSMQVWAQEDQNVTGQTEAASTESETSTPETTGVTALSETTAETPQPESEVSQTQADTAQTEAQSQSAEQTTAQSETTALESVQESNEGQDGSQTEITGQSQTTAETTAPETTAPESQTAEQPAAAKGIMTMEAGDGSDIFNVTSTLSSDSVIAGGTVNVEMQYNVAGGGQYTQPFIQLTLPEGVSYVSHTASTDVNRVNTTERSVVIFLNSHLNTGTSQTITVTLKVDNHTIADNTQLSIPMRVSAKYSGGSGDTDITIDYTRDNVLTVEADDGWNVDKEIAGAVVTGEDYYEIPYRLTVYNQSESAYDQNQESDWNRNGRLNFADGDDSFVLTDILPDSGLPEGGEAISVSDITVTTVVNPSGKTLTEGQDYTVNMQDGHVESITIKHIETLTEDEAENYQYVSAGTPIKTVYTYTVRYPRSPYITPSNEPLKEYTLTNTAQLKYTLIGQTEQTRTANADTKLGEKETVGTAVEFSVEKLISIGGETAVLDDELQKIYGNVEFALYSDKDCTTVASNIDGTQPAGEGQTLDSDGTVTFSDLRSGTYYLAETTGLDGFVNSFTKTAPLAVTVNSKGVSIGSTDQATVEGSTISVTNVSDDRSVVEFTKQGIDASGTTKALPGVTFTLTSKDYPDLTYEAVSDNNGIVRFENVIEGNYTLTETKLPADNPDGYVLDPKGYDVSVDGNAVVKPVFDDNGNVFINQATNGTFSITKVDADDPNTTLEGVEFQLYGPYDSNTEADPEQAGKLVKDENGDAYTLRTDSNGVAQSKPLKEGWYFIKETKAPDHYSVIEDGTWVQVQGHTEKQIPIENQRKVLVYIKKLGTINLGGESGSVQLPGTLAGAKFDIYDAKTGGNLIGHWVTQSDPTGAITSNGVELDAGKTYWYVETKAPEGYTPLKGRIEFTVESSENTQIVKCTNAAEWGQIKIVKTDSKTGEKLKGAVFKLYKDYQCSEEVTINGNPIGNLTTDGNGEVLSPLLPTEDYYIKEVTVPGGYTIIGAGIKKVTVEGSVQTEVTIKNDPLVRAVLTKQDSEKNPIQGAGFTLYEDEQYQKPVGQEVKSDNEGKVTFAGLEPGKTYYYKETTVPTGYSEERAASGEFTVPNTDGLKDDLIYNIERPAVNVPLGGLKISKTTSMDKGDADQGAALSGAVFELYRVNGDNEKPDEKAEPVETGTTGSDGSITWNGLEPGWYYLIETDAPDGHKAADPRWINVTPGSTGDKITTESIEDKATHGKVTIEKVDADKRETKLPGVSFKIYMADDWEANKEQAKLLGTLTTDNNGRATSDWLDPGDYVLVEQPTQGSDVVMVGNDAYDGAGKEIKFTIEEGETTSLTGDQAITNQKLGKFFVDKYARFSVSGGNGETQHQDYELSGATIAIYKAADNAVSDTPPDSFASSDLVQDGITMNGSSYTSDWLAPGKYWVVETKAPDGYELNDDGNAYLVTVTGGQSGRDQNKANVAEIYNESLLGKIRIIKKNPSGDILTFLPEYGEKDGYYLLKEWAPEFEIYQVVDEGTEGAETITQGGKTYTVKKVSAFASDDDNGVTTTDTAGPGQAVTVALEPGESYFIKEVKAPKYHFFENEWTGPIDVERGKEIYQEIINYPEELYPGYKVDENNNKISGVWIGLTENLNDAIQIMSWLEEGGYEGDNEKLSALHDMLEDGSYVNRAPLNLLDQVVKTTGDGFSFKNLVPGNVYFAFEVAPAILTGTYFTYDTSIIKVEPQSDGTIKYTRSKDNGSTWENLGATEPFKFFDYRYGMLEVFKTSILNFEEAKDQQEKVWVEGVKFNVYEARETKNTSSGYSKTIDGETTYYEKVSNTPVASGYTEENGIYRTIPLKPNTMYIIEEEIAGTEDGYYADDREVPEFITLDPTPEYQILLVNSGTVNTAQDADGKWLSDHEFTNPSAWGKFYIKKVDQAGHSMANVTFTLEKKDGNNWVSAGKVTTGTDGTYQSSYLEPGTYRLTEQTPSGYVPIQSIEFKIEPGKITGAVTVTSDSSSSTTFAPGSNIPYTITNTHVGYLQVTKNGVFTNNGKLTDPEDIEKLAGVTFNIYKASSSEDGTFDEFKNDCEGTPEDSITTDSSGIAKASLAPGTYWVVETDMGGNSNKYEPVPKISEMTEANYQKYAQKVTITSMASETDAEKLTFNNVTTWGKFKIKKVDANDSTLTEELAGTEFAIYTTKDITEDTKPVGRITIGKNGTGTSPLLQATDGSTSIEYYIKETKAPDGYKLSETVYGPYTITPNTITEYTTSITKDELIPENSKLYSITVIKEGETGETTSIRLQGVEFALYESKDKAEEDKTNDFKTSGVIGCTENAIGVAKATDDQGMVVFDGLTLLPGEKEKTYYIREIPNAGTEDHPYQDLNDIKYDMGENTIQAVTISADKDASVSVTFVNEQWGKIRIEKTYTWTQEGVYDEVTLPLNGAVFELYKVDRNGDRHSDGDTPADTVVTQTDLAENKAYAVSEQLEEGWYEIVEVGIRGTDGNVIPLKEAGYADPDSYWVEVKNTETNITLTGDKAINNEPVKGRFLLTKVDGAGNDLSGAEFQLYRWIGEDTPRQADMDDTDQWELVKTENSDTITMQGSTYESGMLEAGWYKLVETDAPDVSDGSGGTLSFEMADPQMFEVEVGATASVTFVNHVKGTIRFTKQAVQHDGTGEVSDSTILNDCVFKLYTFDGKDYTPVQENGEDRVFTAANGVYTMTDVAPGTYYIHEESSQNPDYAANSGYFKVIVSDKISTANISGTLVTTVKASDNPDLVTQDGIIKNMRQTGSLKVNKTDESGAPLSGAKFEIYGKNADGRWNTDNPVKKFTIGNGGSYTVTGLPAATDGTRYLVKEVEAPKGYSLDDAYGNVQIQQEVVVYPTTSTDTVNNVTFANQKITANLGQFTNTINKTISDADSFDAEETSTKAVAESSLMDADYEATFTLSGYATGKNTLSAAEFYVEDTNVLLYYMDPQNGTYVQMPEENVLDYTYNKLTLYPVHNKDADQKVTARIEYQLNGEDHWYDYNDGQSFSLESVQEVDLTSVSRINQITGIRVYYMNVQQGFKLDDPAKGIDIQVTFNQRDQFTDETMNEVRRATNTAVLQIQEQYKDHTGTMIDGDIIRANSNSVEALIPTYLDKLPTVSLTNVVTNGDNGQFASGSTVGYEVTATNDSTNGADFIDPIITFDLAPYTYLNTSFGNTGVNGQRGFRIMLQTVNPDGTPGPLQEIDPQYYEIVEDEDVKFIGDVDAGGEQLPSEMTTTRYAFKFDNFTLQPGQSIVIDLQAIISYTKPEGTIEFTSPAYLGSGYKLPASAENPMGTSFTSVSTIDGNANIDETVNEGEHEYIQEPVVIHTADNRMLRIQKQISTDGESYSATDTAYVNPTDKLYYRLTMYNFSDDASKTVRIVDVLPYNGDTYLFNAGESRNTNIPEGEEFEELLFENMEVTGNTQGIESITYYYYVESDDQSNSWSDASTMGDRLKFLYGVNAKADGVADYKEWGGQWTTQKPSDPGLITAVGVEINYKDDQLFTRENPVNLDITVSTPGYTADQIEDYANTQMVNASAGAVVRSTDTGTVLDMGEADRVESNEVVAQLTLPTGAIGDYAFYDHNRNGVQDDGDMPAGNVPVYLYRTVTNTVTNASTESLYAQTVTDADGKYIFEDLPCNYLKKNHTDDLDDPENYVGEEYYSYRVVFGFPEDYGATEQYAGDDTAVDSNIDENGSSEYIQLSVREENGQLFGEENMTVDAGFIRPYQLGNRVWLDYNRNGIQDTYIDSEGNEVDEPGVEDVGVKLYKVDGPDGSIDGLSPYRSTVTDADGMYWFRNLPEGYYVVVFDISFLRKEDGYTYQYLFTDADVSGVTDDFDSDAKVSEELDPDDRIRKTEVIHLSYDANKGKLPDPYSDDTWDAGLMVYSALGGFCFDDENYTDQQDLFIPLPGTVVDLYRVVNGEREAEPIRTATVGDDGRYFFDALVEGQYQIHFTYPEGYYAVAPNVGTNTTDSNTAIFNDGDMTQGYSEIIDLGYDTVDRTWDAGAYMLSSIGDYVWLDENRNGIQDENEHGVEGVTVILQSHIGDEAWSNEAVTVTDQDGKYIFTMLKSSESYGKQYRVVFDFADDTTVTMAMSGEDSGVDSDAVFRMTDLGWVSLPIPVLEYGTSDMTWDAGIVVTKGTVGDFVWYDTNRNGIQDEGETGVAGIEVVLEINETGDVNNEDGWAILDETTTNEHGYYRFWDLDTGYYRVRFKVPEEYNITLYNQGTDLEVDSDASREATERWYYGRSFYFDVDENPIDLSWDAGIYKQSDLITTVIERRPGETTIIRGQNIYRTVTRRVVRTGDNMRPWLWSVVAVISAGAAVTIIIVKRRNKRKENQN